MTLYEKVRRSKPHLRILHLNLIGEFFEDIAIGKKREEYRDKTSYWKKRLEGRDYDVILFRNGYASRAPEMLVQYKGLRQRRRAGAPQYVIQLGRVLKTEQWRR